MFWGASRLKTTDWKGIAEIVGIGAIVASLVFVGLQLQQSQTIAFSERQQEQSEREIAIHDFIANNVNLIIKLNSGDQLSDAEEMLADRLVRSLWITYFFSASQADLLDTPGRDAPIRALASILHRNPGLQEYYRKHRERHEREFHAMMGRPVDGYLVNFLDAVDKYLSSLESMPK